MNVRRRRLVRTLVYYREKSGLSMEQVAEALVCGVGTIHRMETGQNAVPLRVKTALELYGAQPEVVQEMVQLAKDKDKSNVVRHYRHLVSKTHAEYLDLEIDATELRVLESGIAHGLLQTEDYARAIISVGALSSGKEEVDRLVTLRMERQKRIAGPDSVEFYAVLGEAALHNQIGGPKVLKAQLERLLELGKLPNVTIQILPFTAGAHPALGCDFTILSFPDPADPNVVYTDNLASFSILEEAEDVRPFKVAFSRVTAEALSPRQSAKLIARKVAELAT